MSPHGGIGLQLPNQVMTQIRRIFIDWKQPSLPAAAELLLDGKVLPSAGRLLPGDLSDTIAVVPGGRAGRRLLEILVEKAEARGVGLSPPAIITVGGLPELLYPPQRPFASDLVQRLAWVESLRSMHRATLARVVPQLPAAKETVRWLELADLLRSQHLELAADGRDCADLVQETARLGERDESRRWEILHEVQQAYLKTLDELELWDKQTARLVAIERRECATDRQIVLIGTVDMNQALREMLDQVADRVTALVFAPEQLAAAFDSHGCLSPDAWADVRMRVADDHLQHADGPIDQAYEAARSLADLDGKFRADEITIGVCDQRIVPQIQRQLAQCNVPARWGPGHCLREGGPFRLLLAAADYLEHRRLAQFAALLRHTDVEAWLLAQGLGGDWFTQLDEYQAAHLQTQLGEAWLGKQDKSQLIRRVHAALSELFADLAGPTKAINEWGPPIRQMLQELYGHREFDPQTDNGRMAMRSLEQLLQAVADQQLIPPPLLPRVTGAEALRIALEAVAGDTVAPPADDEAVELLGWLELPLDDAPALVVTTFNDGLVPKSVNSDLFLPDRLRRELGLDDNARRYARDAYALSVLLASRKALRLIVGRRDSDDNPLPPSRLLFACDDAKLTQRALEFFQPPPPLYSKPPLAGTFSATREKSLFDVPRPRPLSAPIDSLRTTDFKAYLQCPYRFYLRRMLDLQSLDDTAEEMDPASFGGLIHNVLNQFGDDPQRHTCDYDEIREILDKHLDQLLEAAFGSYARAAVAVQIEQMRMRLHMFADRQAQWAARGWQIQFTEVPSEQRYLWTVDGQPFHLRGRIDRIDRHQESGQWAIFDYKSGENPDTVEAAHRDRDGNWIDLQLPLYRRLASILEVDGDVQLGYILLPKSEVKCGFDLAMWNAADLQAADDTAEDIIRAVRREIFWPPTVDPPSFSEDLAAICLDNVFERPDLTEFEVSRAIEKPEQRPADAEHKDDPRPATRQTMLSLGDDET